LPPLIEAFGADDGLRSERDPAGVELIDLRFDARLPQIGDRGDSRAAGDRLTRMHEAPDYRAVDRRLDERLLQHGLEAADLSNAGGPACARGVEIALARLPRLLRAHVLREELPPPLYL